jgi:hypothetical protein
MYPLRTGNTASAAASYYYVPRDIRPSRTCMAKPDMCACILLRSRRLGASSGARVGIFINVRCIFMRRDDRAAVLRVRAQRILHIIEW